MTTAAPTAGTRRGLTLMAVFGLHVVAFQLIAGGLIPRLLEPLDRTPPPIRVVFPEPEPIERVRPATVDLPAPYASPVVEPELDLPEFPESQAAPPAPARHADAIEGTGRQASPTETVPPSVRTRDARLSALVDACYPAASRRLGEEGRVLARVRIGADGRAVSWRVEQSSGFERLDAALACVVPAIEFTPAHRGGRAIESEANLPVTFALR